MYYSRGKNKHQSPYTFQHMYKEYIKEIDEDSPYHIPYSKFKDICSEYYRLKMEQIFKGGIMLFNHGLGSLSILKKKPKKFESKHLQIDWENTSRLGKVVHHINDHSNYYKFSFRWCKKQTRCANNKLYSLTMSRENKRKLAKIIKGGYTDFFEQD